MEENQDLAAKINVLIEYELVQDMAVALANQIEMKDIINKNFLNKNIINGIILDDDITLQQWIYKKIGYGEVIDDHIEPFIYAVVERMLKPYLNKLDLDEIEKIFKKIKYNNKTHQEWKTIIDKIKETNEKIKNEKNSKFGKIFTGKRGGRYYKRKGRKIYI